jgi:diguanylate cyclase (GGDEF)-like protein
VLAIGLLPRSDPSGGIGPAVWIRRNAIAITTTVLLALLCRRLAVLPDPAMWLPSGLGCALAIRWGWGVLPGLWLGSVLAEVAASGWAGQALLIGSLGCLEPLLLVLVHRWFPHRDPFRSVRLLLFFGLLCLLSGLLYTLLTDHWLPHVAARITGLPSALARFTGIQSLAPLVLALLQAPPAERFSDFRRWPWWLFLGGMLLGWAVVQVNLVPAMRATPMAPILPLMVAAAFRLLPTGQTALLLVVVVLEFWVPFPGGGSLAERFSSLGEVSLGGLRQTSLEGLGQITLQRLVLYSQIVVLFTMASLQERRRMVAALEAQSRRLEEKVAERTQELVLANARLERLSQRDGLTGIANRRRFDQALLREWASARSQGHLLSLAIFDVDHFKAYNDHYGHQAGDRVLRRVAGALGSGLRPGDRHLIARYGGEEFVVLFTGISADDAAQLAVSLHQAVARLAIVHQAGGPERLVTVSGGLATLRPAADLAPSALVAAADTMLYAAKAGGRNRLLVAGAGDPAAGL